MKKSTGKRHFDKVLSQVLGEFWRSLEKAVVESPAFPSGWRTKLVTWTKRNPYVGPDVHLAITPPGRKGEQYLYPFIQQVESRNTGLELIVGVGWARKHKLATTALQIPQVGELREALQPQYRKSDRWNLAFRVDRRLTDRETLKELFCNGHNLVDSRQGWHQRLADEVIALIATHSEQLGAANGALRRQ